MGDDGVSDSSGSASRGRGRRVVGTEASSTPPGSTQASSEERSAEELPRRLDRLALGGKAEEELTTVSQRPGYGKAGRPLSVDTNYFRLRIPDNLVVQRWQIDVAHRVRRLDKDDHREVFWACVGENEEAFGSSFAVIYDDSNCAYTLARPKFPGKDGGARNEFVFKVLKLQPRDNRAEEYSVSWKYAGAEVVRMADVATQQHSLRSTISLQILDLIVNQSRRCPLLPAQYRLWYPHNRGIFRRPAHGGEDLGGGRQLWAGYSAAGKVGENWLPLLNVDIANTAFYKHQPLLGYMVDVLNEAFDPNHGRSGGGGGRGGGRGGRGGGPRGGGRGGYQSGPPAPPMFTVGQLTRSSRLMPQWVSALKRSLSGVKLKTTHMPEDRNRVYKFVDVSPSGAQDITFIVDGQAEGEQGTTVQLVDYYRDKYGRDLLYPALNVIQVGPRQRQVYLPIEFLEIYSPQKVNKQLKDQQLAKMIRASARPAPERLNMIKGLVADIRPDEDPFMRQFRVGMEAQPMSVPARVLPAVELEQGKGQRLTVREGVWDTRPFVLPATCPGYSLISFLQQRDRAMLENFCENQVKTCQMAGMVFERQWPDVVAYVQRKEELERELKRCVAETASKGLQCKLVFVVMGGKDSGIYSEAKRWGDVEEGVMTQCVLRKNAATVADRPPGLASATAANIAMKLNIKLGGVNSRIASHAVWDRFAKATLFLGVDVTHPGVGEADKPSIGCVVGNVDTAATQWAANLKIQARRREHMVYMQEETRAAIVRYYTQTGVKPAQIVVYRDGVSEGQFLQVLNEEMRGIREACARLGDNFRPLITFIVVQKRHHSRLFVKNPRDGVGRAANVPPGTVVDHGITHPCEFDFFLCSHLGIQGTARPTHYYVLHDDAAFSADQLQMLSYQLCHLFGRCNRVVGIPAPVYFADLCCTRANYHVRSKLHGSDSSSSRPLPSSASAASSTSDAALMDAVKVHDNLALSMYYI